MSNHTDLNVLLDKIEERASTVTGRSLVELLQERRLDNLALVKALRRAMDISRELVWQSTESLEIAGERMVNIDKEITAILQASSEPKGEKE